MKKEVLLSILFLLKVYISPTQNLIPNSDFEETKTGEYIPNESIKNLKCWKKILPSNPSTFTTSIMREMYIDTSYKFRFYYDKKEFKQYFTDYTDFEANPVDTSKLVSGIFNFDILPYSGSCYIKNSGNKKRNLIQAKLKEPLKKDHFYFFEMYYRIGTTFNKKITLFKTGNFGILFSNYDFSDNSLKKSLLKGTTKYVPQILIKKFPSECVTDWVKFSQIIKISENYKYILIGNHSIPSNNYRCEFYIDKLKLIPFEKKFSSNNFKKGEPIIIPNIYFNSNSNFIKTESYASLNLIYNFLNENKNIGIKIIGHTDNTGSKNYNNKLSENRAKAVVKYLSLKGISEKRLQFKGYGDTKPIDTNTTPEGRQNNRRVEFIIL